MAKREVVVEVTYDVGLKQTLCGVTIELAAKSCGLRLYQRIGEHKIGDSSEMVPKPVVIDFTLPIVDMSLKQCEPMSYTIHLL